MANKLRLAVLALAAAAAIYGLSGGGGGPATAAPAIGAVTPDCSTAAEGRVRVRFEWGPDDEARELWADLSTVRNDFAPGTYVSAGPFPTGTREFIWEGIQPGIAHIFRIRTVQSGSGRPLSFYKAFTPCGEAAVLFEPNWDCVGSTANVNFDWAPATPGGTQWLDLSTQDNGFQPGTFVSFGPLSSQQQMQLWMRITPNVTHYFRVNTLMPGGNWSPSTTGSFTPQCGQESGQTCALGSERLGRAGQITEEAGLFTYYFDGGTSTNDRALVRSAMDLAQAWNAFVFGHGLTAPTCVELLTASSGSVAGVAAGHRILVFAGHPLWQQAPEADKLLVMLHEHFHVFQAELMRVPIILLSRPWWVIEGSADFIAQRMAADFGVIREEPFANSNRARAREVPALADLETGPGSSPPGGYALANIAAEYLVQRNGYAALARFFDLAATQDWQVAFQQAFGQPVNQFYAEFEQYRFNGYR